MKTTIQKWGNSYAMRIPAMLVRRLRLRAGHVVTIAEEDGATALRIVPITENVVPPLNTLLAQINPDNTHSETAWSSIQGKEVW